MPGNGRVFVSYGGADRAAAGSVYRQLTGRGLDVFRDVETLRAGVLWLERLQESVDGCGAFVLLIGRDGVRRWAGAETQVAPVRFFGPRDDGDRLPIFPVLLDGSAPETLPAFLRLFQATPWDGTGPLPDSLLDGLRTRALLTAPATSFEGRPFVGPAAYRPDQAHLFFGRQKETLDALACFETRGGHAPVRWLEINGNSGSGKSSLMNAGLLPLIEEGWLWPRTGFAHWTRIGPMMPGEKPIRALAEALTRRFKGNEPLLEMADVRARLEEGDDLALADWLGGRKRDEGAFLLAIDQFEEMFTFADPAERTRFDALLAAALDDPDCPLFVLSTVRADFLDRFAEDLPRLVVVKNGAAKAWTLGPIGEAGLREVIDGPARLAGIDASEVREAIIDQARGEPGALPLVENALDWLWQHRERRERDEKAWLSGRLFTESGGLAGLLSRSADDLLDGLGPQRAAALKLLFRLIRVDPEGVRHARQRIGRDEAVAIAGGGEAGLAVVGRLSGQRRPEGGPQAGPLRLITVGDDGAVNLIHETLIRSKGLDEAGNTQPYWPTLWHYIENNKQRAVRRERLQLMAREWKDRTGLSRFSGLAGWSSLLGFRGLAAPNSLEQRYLRWSRARAVVEALVLLATLGVVGESVAWARKIGAPIEAVMERWAYRLHVAKPALPPLVDIPAGSFRMGSEKDDRSKPVHQVTFAEPFSLGATEVTFREWDACVADGGCNYRPYDQGWGRETRPVINVSWNDAQAYVVWLSRRTGKACRLPSEAEWEYAARAGTVTEYALPAPSGSNDIRFQPVANCATCGRQSGEPRTLPVGSFKPNAWGIYDAHGNVFEWVEDCVQVNYEHAPTDGTARRGENDQDCANRVQRGGSWNSPQDYASSASRLWVGWFYRNFSTGFRVLCSSPISSGTEP